MFERPFDTRKTAHSTLSSISSLLHSMVPAIKDHESFPQPSDPNAVLWRYMDLPKLVSFLAHSTLHLTQLGTLDDPLEGHYPPPVRQAMIDWWQQQLRDKLDSRVSSGYPADNLTAFVRASLYVNCWCLQEHESEAMWRIFGGMSGVAVRTRYSKLAHALPDDVFIGTVQYIDPEHRQFPVENTLSLAMFKRHFYKHEMECRVVKMLTFTMNGDQADMTFDRYPSGIALPLVITEAIDDVVTSPLAPLWYHDAVKHVVERFAPGLPVHKSIMRP